MRGSCSCPARQTINGTVLEGFRGQQCEKGPKLWLGRACDVCVAGGGYWCSGDGICSRNGTRPTEALCPKSVAMGLELRARQLPGFVVRGNPDACRPGQRACASLAAPVLAYIADAKPFGGVCGAKAKTALQGMQAVAHACNDLHIGDAGVHGDLASSSERYSEVLERGMHKRRHCGRTSSGRQAPGAASA